MGCKPLDEIVHSGHKDIKISGDGLVALRLSTCFQKSYLKSTDNSLHFFLFSMLSMTHNTNVESTFLHLNWLQVWLLYCPRLLLATGVSKYKLQEHHMLGKQLFLTISTRCQSFCPVHFWVLCEILSSVTSLLCLFLCVCCCSANNKHVKTKTFAIGIIFWEKCCIFWQNCYIHYTLYIYIYIYYIHIYTSLIVFLYYIMYICL